MNSLAERSESSSFDIKASSIFKFFTTITIIVVMFDLISRFIRPTDNIAQYIQSQTYVGISDPRIIEATSDLTFIDLINEHPYTPWVSVNFINDGPDSVMIAINQPTATYELKAEETASVYRIGAQERIISIFFKCSPGEEASVRVIGEY